MTPWLLSPLLSFFSTSSSPTVYLYSPSPPIISSLLLSHLLVCIFFPVIFCQAGKEPFGVLPTTISTVGEKHTHTPNPIDAIQCLIQLSTQSPIIPPSHSIMLPCSLLCFIAISYLPSTILSTFVPFSSLFSSGSLSSLHHNSLSPIYPSAVMRKLGRLSHTWCVCVHAVACVYGATGIAFQAGSFALAMLLCFPAVSVSMRICVCVCVLVHHFLGDLDVTHAYSHPPLIQLISVTIRECICASRHPSFWQISDSFRKAFVLKAELDL